MQEESEVIEEILKFSDQFYKLEGRRPRLMIASACGKEKNSLNQMSSRFADMGFDVDIAPLVKSPEHLAKQAIENDVHLLLIHGEMIGITRMTYDIVNHFKAFDRQDILLIISADEFLNDQDKLKIKEVAGLFNKDERMAKMAKWMMHRLIDKA